jgi:uncharacterized protein (TIGR03382 family)
MRNWLRLLAATAPLFPIALVAASCGGRSSSVDPADGTDASLSTSQPATVAATPTPAPAGAPAALRIATLRAQQQAPGYDFVGSPADVLESHAGSHGAALAVHASSGAVKLTSARDLPAGAFELGLATTSVGRTDGTAGSRGVVGQRAEGQEVVVTRTDGVEERFLAGPLGLEQSYTLATRPTGTGSLVIQVAFDGLAPELAAGTTDRVGLRDAAGHVRTWYTDLTAVDATGRPLASRMTVSGGGVALVIDDNGATYPVSVDPLVWTLQTELTVTTGTQPGAAGDWLGASVAMSGSLAIVGAPNHASGAGAAYVFALSGTTWTLQQALTASDGKSNDAFGTSVALSGTTAVVGAPYHTGAKTESGAAYVFTQSGTTWTQQPTDLVAPDAVGNDGFGTSVSISGTALIVGAPSHDITGKGELGAAYLFAESGTTWSEQQEVTASDGHIGDQFGFSVAVSGTTAIVGAYQHDATLGDGGTASAAGAAYVFGETGTTWGLQQELSASDAATADFFGYSVALSGQLAVVGAYQHNSATVQSAGAAYVYGGSGTTWTLQQELAASDGQPNDAFGISVAVSGGTAVVGAYQHLVGSNAQQGAAYAFTQSGTTWTQQQELTATDGKASDLFGASVAASGDYAMVGAYQHEVGSNLQQGAAYVFLGAITGATGCYIGGTLYASGALEPGNDCETCAPATSTTGWSPVTCTSPDACHTAGTCAAATGCSAPVLDAGFCYIAGVCVASGADNGANTCQTCQPTVSTSTYSNVTNGTTCNDGNQCDLNDTCQAGTCTAGSHVTCTAPDSCHTAGTCSASTGTCSAPTLDTGFCYIGGACVATGAVDPANACQTCQPTLSTAGYSNVANGTTCNDGNRCDLNDTCQAGTCTAGSHVTCTAPDSCHTAGTCSASTGTCSAPILDTGFCYIAGSCVASGAAESGDLCETCQPSLSTTGYSSVPNGTVCGTGEVCNAGVCTVVITGTDAGSPTDAGSSSDAGGPKDAGSTSNDAGSATDGGITFVDGGSVKDAGGTSGDGGSTQDGGAASGDGGGTTLDGGGASGDGGASEDGGSTTEDGGGVSSEDSGVSMSEDAGVSTSEDAGTSTGEDGGSIVIGVPGEDSGLATSGDGGEDGGASSGLVGQGNGCGCSTVGSPTHEDSSLLMGVGVLGLVVVSRRRRGTSRK